MQPPRYSNVLAKIGAGRGQLLSEEKIKMLAESRNLSDFIAQIRETKYQEQLSKISAPISSRELERVLNESLIESFIKIVKNSPKNAQGLLKTYLLKVELENTKTLLKIASSQLTYDQKVDKIYFSVEDFLKNREVFEEATKASSISQIMSVLKNMPYSSALNMGLKSYEESGSTACLDVFIDRFFYEKLFESYETLPKNEQLRAFNFVSIENDGFTLLSLLRGKALDYDPNWLRLAVPKNNFNLHKVAIEEMVTSLNFDSAFKIAIQTVYGEYFAKALTTHETISIAEKAFDKALLKLAKKSIVSGNFSIAAPLSFMAQKKVEAQNLIAIVAGIEANVEPEHIQSQLLF